MRANDITGDRTLQWEAGGWTCLFYFECFVLILCKYVKSLWRGIYFETLYDRVIYILPIMVIWCGKNIGMLHL